MERIPPEERFSHNEKSLVIPEEILFAALSQSQWDPRKTTLTKLSGGFMNANYKAVHESERQVLRVYSTDSHFAQKEYDLLRFLSDREILTPKVYDVFEIEGRPVVLMEFLEGVTLEDHLLSGGTNDPSIYESVGRELGKIHAIHFDHAGFIGPGMQLSHQFTNFSAFVGEFIDKTLRDLESQPEKLDLEANRRFRRLFEDKWQIAVDSEKFPQLVHCDFNPKNILVLNNEVSGVIDWEFSDSGNGMIDFGNFFRFSYDYPAEAREHFVRGYREVNPNLPENWETAARLMDLGNMCGFLERKEDYQKTFRTARAVIKSTLEHFGY